MMAILWSLWFNRNSVIFRRHGKNLSSLLYQILHLTSYWTDTLLIGHGSVISSISQAIQQIQHDLDQVHTVQASSTPLVRPINIPMVTKIPSNLTDNSTISLSIEPDAWPLFVVIFRTLFDHLLFVLGVFWKYFF